MDQPLTLDQVLAMDVPNYSTDYAAMMKAIKTFVENPALKGTALDILIVPVVRDLQAWLILFSSNMRNFDNRLQSNMRLRVCFAERGMDLTLKLVQTSQDSIVYLTRAARVDPTPQIVSLSKALNELLLAVMGCNLKGLSLMRNWLSTLVDIVPVDQRSKTTPLLQSNMVIINTLCKRLVP